jgi:RNAse (barnase) inhibitor barstar
MNEASKSHPLLSAARSGVYCTPAHVDAVKQAVAGQAHWVEVDVGGLRSKGELLDALAAAYGFPDTFGRNWDALADALSDLSWQRDRAYVLRLREAARPARALGADWATFIDVLAYAAREWQSREVPFVVFADDITELPRWI